MKKRNYTLQLLQLLTQTLIEKNLLQSNRKILLSVSTGQDSIFLYILFVLLKKQWNFYSGLIWCNHFWQKDSFYNFFQLVKLEILWMNPFYISLTPYKIYTEKESRFWRQDLTSRLSQFYNYDIISIAHTGSDRIETLFFQLIRGTGSNGIRSLAWTTCQTSKYPNEIHISIFYSISFFTAFLLQNTKTVEKRVSLLKYLKFKFLFSLYNKKNLLSNKPFKIKNCQKKRKTRLNIYIVKKNYLFEL